MKPITTEEIILVPCLLVGWAIATIARDVAAPLAALVLTLLGWRPKPPLAYVMNCSSGTTRPTWDPALVAKLAAPVFAGRLQRLDPGAPLPDVVDNGSKHLTWEQMKAIREASAPMPPHIAITHQPLTFSSRDVLQSLFNPQLRSMARLRGIDPVGLSRKELIEALLDDAVDRANNYSAEVPTAAERSPSLRRGRP
jgi:hypothetical protein